MSRDEKHVANYAPWRSQADFDARWRIRTRRFTCELRSRSPRPNLLRPARESFGKVGVARYWVGVASRDHVQKAVEGGFCQVNMAGEAPLTQIACGDRFLYSPREGMSAGKPIKAFTAIGKIADEEPYQTAQSKSFKQFRRRVDFSKTKDAERRFMESSKRLSRRKSCHTCSIPTCPRHSND